MVVQSLDQPWSKWHALALLNKVESHFVHGLDFWEHPLLRLLALEHLDVVVDMLDDPLDILHPFVGEAEMDGELAIAVEGVVATATQTSRQSLFD